MAKEITSSSLRRINIIAGVLHLAQMAAVLALSTDFALPITARYMSGPPGSTYGDLFILQDQTGIRVLAKICHARADLATNESVM